MFSGLMMNTWIAASIVAVIAGVTGFFAVLRGQSFAAHAIPNGAFAGAAGAGLLGLNVIWGLAVFALGGALGIVLAYDSYYWPPRGHGWPVSFFVVTLVLMGYLISYVRPHRKRAPRSPHEDECGGPEMIAVSTGNTASTGGTATCSPA